MRAKFAVAEQGSYEWLVERIPYVTASNVADVMAKGQGKSRAKYLSRKFCEIVTNQPTKTFKSAKMQDGNDREQKSREIYEQIKNCSVKQLPFAYLEEEGIGASIDGEPDPKGLLEIKNVMSSEQIELLNSENSTTGKFKIKDKYVKQMQTQMYVLDKEWCDFMSTAFGDEESGELPNALKVKIIRVYRDEEMIARIRKEVAFFHHDLRELRKKLGV